MDRIRGVLYGQAIGDALGVPYESKPAHVQVPRYQQTIRPKEVYLPGEYSDDTEMALCILYAYRLGGSSVAIARQFLHWGKHIGKGMGGHTRNVIFDSRFLSDPEMVSLAHWEESGRTLASNGAVMRSSYVGLLRPHDLAWTQQEAIKSARVTHYDPRCVASAVAVSVAVADLVCGKSVAEAIVSAQNAVKSISPEMLPYLSMDLESLQLAEGLHIQRKGAPIGYTGKCLGAGFWALRQCVRGWLPPIQDIIQAGGDTDSNAAVAGALLGAALGFDALPQDLVSGLKGKEPLEEVAKWLV